MENIYSECICHAMLKMLFVLYMQRIQFGETANLRYSTANFIITYNYHDIHYFYTCTQADLESLNKVGPDTASKIIALRQRVIGGLDEPLQVADLAAVRLSVEEWQGFIDNDLLSITYEDLADPNLDQVFEQMEEPVNPAKKETAEHGPYFEENVSNSISLLAQSLHSLDKKVYDLGTKLTSKLDTVSESVTTLQNSGFKSDMENLK